jgi:hypothetical protein
MKPETRRNSGKSLHAREERVIALLLGGKTLLETCEQVPISKTSLWRLRGNEEFKKRFAEAKQQAFDTAVNCLHDGAAIFVKTLREICEDSKARGSERASAARSGLDSLVKVIEVFDHRGTAAALRSRQ